MMQSGGEEALCLIQVCDERTVPRNVRDLAADSVLCVEAPHSCGCRATDTFHVLGAE
jgi:uncharacterized protein (UPF0147 family)